MSEDARFEDGEDKALNIGAFDKRDLEVLSSLVQDSILPTSEIKWLSNADKLAILINNSFYFLNMLDDSDLKF